MVGKLEWLYKNINMFPAPMLILLKLVTVGIADSVDGTGMHITFVWKVATPTIRLFGCSVMETFARLTFVLVHL